MPPRPSSVTESATAPTPTAEAREAGEGSPAGHSSGFALEVDGLVRRYGERPALDGVSVRVARGSTLTVLGPNGAGKSTLLRVLATLLRPHAGSVRVLGWTLPRDAAAVRTQVGYVGHEPLLYRDLTARENLRFHARLRKVEPARVDELLEATGMTRRAAQPAAELSRGMRQRLAVARALLADPPLLLLDEPRANLDPAAAELLQPLIGRASGRTRVLVSHDVESALAESDAVLGLRAGRRVVAGDADSVDAASLARALFPTLPAP
jgi:heme exporter protein A